MNEKFMPGTLVEFEGNAWTDKLIKFGERLRGKKGSQFSHMGIIVDMDGGTVEAVGRGIVKSRVGSRTYKILDPFHPDDKLAYISCVTYARWCANPKRNSKIKYGYLTIISIAIDLIFGGKFSFRSGNTLICSELAAKAAEHGGWICPKLDTSHVMPSDMDKWLS